MNSERPVPGSSSGSSAIPIVLGVLCVGLLLVCGGAGAAYFLVVRRSTLARAEAEHARAKAEMQARVAAVRSAPTREVVIRLRPGAGGAVSVEVDGQSVGTVYDMDKVVKPISENTRVYGEAAGAVRRSAGEQKAKVVLWPGPGGAAEHVAGLEKALAARGFDDVEIGR